MGWRSFGIGLVVVFAAIFVFVNRSQVPAAWDASTKADPRFLMLAAVSAAVYLLPYGELYRRALPRSCPGSPLRTGGNRRLKAISVHGRVR